jgi:hypothetical protein
VNEQHASTQEKLVDFLQADLELCFTMLHTSRLASDPVHRHSALEKVQQGLQVIRDLSGRIENPEWWKAVNTRADELERALESVPGPRSIRKQATNI